MKSLVLLFAMIVCQGASANFSVDPQSDWNARQQLEAKPWVISQTEEVHSRSFESSHFKGETAYIVTRSLDLPDGLDPAMFARQKQIFMFVSQDYLWFCQFAVNVLWKSAEPVELVDGTFEADGEVWCYPRI